MQGKCTAQLVYNLWFHSLMGFLGVGRSISSRFQASILAVFQVPRIKPGLVTHKQVHLPLILLLLLRHVYVIIFVPAVDDGAIEVVHPGRLDT